MKKILAFVAVLLVLLLAWTALSQYGSGQGSYGTIGLGGGNINSTNLYTTTNSPLPGSFYRSPDGTNGAWDQNIQSQPVGNADALYITNTGNAFAQEQFFNGTTNGGIILSATYGGFLLTQPLTVFGGFSFTNLTTGENLDFSPGLILGNSNDVVKVDMVTSGTQFSMQVQSPVAANQIVIQTNANILLGNAPNDTTSSNGLLTAISFAEVTNNILPVVPLAGVGQLSIGGPGGTNLYLVMINAAGTKITNKFSYGGQYP